MESGKIKNLIDKFKAFYDDKYGMLIVVSWTVLIICLIIKLFGGNWFELGVENTKFINFCNYVENTQWLKMTIACLIYLLTTYPVLCCILNKRYLNKKLTLYFISLIIVKSIVGWYSVIFAFILDFIIIILLPLVICKFKNWKRVIFGNLLIMVFQLVTIGIRNLSMNFNLGNTVIENYLIQVDYYIMVLLFYLYNFKRKKEQ